MKVPKTTKVFPIMTIISKSINHHPNSSHSMLVLLLDSLFLIFVIVKQQKQSGIPAYSFVSSYQIRQVFNAEQRITSLWLCYVCISARPRMSLLSLDV